MKTRSVRNGFPVVSEGLFFLRVSGDSSCIFCEWPYFLFPRVFVRLYRGISQEEAELYVTDY